MKRLLVAAGAVAVSAAIATPAAVAHPTAPAHHPRHLHVMLTNDDGATAPGLIAVRDALCRTGDVVTVVAPATNQSGSSARITTGGSVTATRTAFRCGSSRSVSWAVGGSPADTVFFAQSVVFAHSRPDLVVSGTNAGDNIGSGVASSGTVGAAVTATNQGLPAIAVSSGVTSDASATAAGYAATGAFVARLVHRLAATPDHSRLLPRGTLLNVNYPLPLDRHGRFAARQVGDARWTTIARQGPPLQAYSRDPKKPGSYQLTLQACGQLGGAPCPREPGSDQTAIARNDVSVTALTGFADTAPATARVHRQLRGFVR